MIDDLVKNRRGSRLREKLPRSAFDPVPVPVPEPVPGQGASAAPGPGPAAGGAAARP
jgi:hypothetical protein